MSTYIALPLWKEIIELLQDERETLKQIRLVCKLFRNLVAPYWRQIISSENLSSYFRQLAIFHFDIYQFVIEDKLCEVDLEINLEDLTDDSVLFTACQNGYFEIIELLLKNGVDINKSNNNGETPLFMASQNGYLEIVELLLKSGVSVNESNNNGETPLFFACKNGYLEIVELLIIEQSLTRRCWATIFFLSFGLEVA